MIETSQRSRARTQVALRPRRTLTAASVLGAVALALAIGPRASAAAPREGASRATAIPVAVAEARPGAVIAPDFLGLSFETTVLSSPALRASAPPLVALLRNLGAGVMRVSGVSADRTQWLGAPGALAPWSIATIAPADLANLASLMRSSGWRLLLGLNLGHVSAPALVEETRSTARILAGSLAGVMIGNEPDLYTHPPSAPFRAAIGGAALRPPGWGLPEYESEVSSLRAALAAAGVPAAVYGPDTATSRWLESYADAQAVGLAALAQHYYPLDRCSGGRLLRVAASPAGLLSPGVARRESHAVAGYMRVAATHGLALRIDEANSVACAGQPGTSDTFAGALWALDFSLLAAERGAAGVNFHGGLGSCAAGGTIVAPWYSPLCTLPDGQLHARPEYYALVLLRSLEGCAFLPVTYASSRNIAVYALRAPDGSLRIVIDDKEVARPRRFAPRPAPAPAWLSLRVGSGYRRASVVSLTAPAAAARGEVRLGGAMIGADGTLATPLEVPLPRSLGGFEVRVVPASAAVITLRR
jgi:hypothetical protein